MKRIVKNLVVYILIMMIVLNTLSPVNVVWADEGPLNSENIKFLRGKTDMGSDGPFMLLKADVFSVPEGSSNEAIVGEYIKFGDYKVEISGGYQNWLVNEIVDYNAHNGFIYGDASLNPTYKLEDYWVVSLNKDFAGGELELKITDNAGNTIHKATVSNGQILSGQNVTSAVDGVVRPDGKVYQFKESDKKGQYFSFKVEPDQDGNGSGTYEIVRTADGQPITQVTTGGNIPLASGYPTEEGIRGEPADMRYRVLKVGSVYLIAESFGEVSIQYRHSNMDVNVNDTGVDIQEPLPEGDEAELFERIITSFLLVIGDGTLHLIGIALGGDVSLDSLVFNQYTNTQLSFFDGEGGRNAIIAGNSANINQWFAKFRNIAMLCYLIICLYMGIRIVLSSTGGSKAKYQDLVGYWLKGIVILFLFPYVMKYTILLNNTMVAIINENKSGIFTEQITGIQGIEGGFGNSMNYGNDDRFSGDDYMGSMRKIAAEKGWAAYAIVWLIMITQLVTFIFLYYKRLLMVMFLIIIFPLVTISYAIDKVGDGKSQAFNNWFKEFFINVFIQLFHAILYVLVMGTIFSSGGSAFSANWLLIMFGITFISKGEPILRGLLGQGGSGAGTLTSIAATAIATRGMVKATQSFGKKVAKQGAHFKSSVNAARQYRSTYLGMRKGFIPKTSPQGETEEQSGTGIPVGVGTNGQEDALPESVQERKEQIANAMATMNNPGGDPAAKAIAARTLQKYRGTKELNEVLKASGVDVTEYSELMGAIDVMANINMLNDVQINQKLKVLRRNIGRGGMYASMLAQSGMSEDEIEELYEKSMLLGSIRVGEGVMMGVMMAGAGDSFYDEEQETGSPSRDISERIRVGTIKNGRGKRISGATKRQGRMTGRARGTQTGSETSSSGKGTMTGSNRGPSDTKGTGSISALQGERGSRMEGANSTKKSSQDNKLAAPEYIGTFESKSRNVSKTSSNRAAKMQRRREAQKSMHRNMANSYIKEALGVKDMQELNTLQDRKEAQSYMKLAGAAAKLNNTNTGVYDFEEIKKSIDIYRAESEKEYAYTDELADKLNFDIDEYEYNWAVEVSKHAEQLDTAENDTIRKQAQEIIEKNAGKAEKIRTQMKQTKDVQEMEELRKKAEKYEAVEEKLNAMQEDEPIKMEEIDAIQAPDLTNQEGPIDWGDYKKEKLKEAISEFAKGAVGTTVGVAGGVFGAAAGAAVSGANEKDVDKVIAGAAVGSNLGSSFGTGVASIPEVVSERVGDILKGNKDELSRESRLAYEEARTKYEAEYIKKMQEAYQIGKAEAEAKLQQERERRRNMYSLGDKSKVNVIGKDGRSLPKKDIKK